MQDSLFESVVSRPRLQELTASCRIVAFIAFIAFIAAVFRFKTGGVLRQKSNSKEDWIVCSRVRDRMLEPVWR